MLEQIFLKVMDMSWSASMIIAIVFIVRIFEKVSQVYFLYVLERCFVPASLSG